MHADSVFLLDGDSREAVAIARSLGRHGIHVRLATERRMVAAAFSKYVETTVKCPSPRSEEFITWLKNTLKESRARVLMSVRDDTTSILVNHADELSELCGMAVPERKSYETALSKLDTMRLARDFGVPTPRTLLTKPRDSKEVEEAVGFPCVIKPEFSSGSRGIAYVSNPSEFARKYDAVVAAYGESIVQEKIPRQGTAYGVSMLFNKGKPRAIFSHRRLREYPPTGGPSTLRESVRRPDIEKFATTLLTGLKWHGVAMVEFKIYERDGIPKLMEINPRFWGSLQLGISAGVDFPFLLYTLIVNGDVDPVMTYALRVRCRWLLFGDVLWFLSSKKKLGNIGAFLKFKEKGLHYDIVSLDDFGPVVGSCLDAFTSLLDKQRREHVLKRGI